MRRIPLEAITIDHALKSYLEALNLEL